jgi:hypothetical protein
VGGCVSSTALFCAAMLLAMPRVASTPDKLSDLQARFDRETNSVRKAKLLEKISIAHFEETRRLEKASDFNAVGLLWEKYRDNARATLVILKKQHPDAERHSSGYRELEIGLREGVREIDQSMIIAPLEYRPPLQIVRSDLTAMDDEVLRMLFPRRTVDVPPPAAFSEMQP